MTYVLSQASLTVTTDADVTGTAPASQAANGTLSLDQTQGGR
jgi:hypothetical protein